MTNVEVNVVQGYQKLWDIEDLLDPDSIVFVHTSNLMLGHFTIMICTIIQMIVMHSIISERIPLH